MFITKQTYPENTKRIEHNGGHDDETFPDMEAVHNYKHKSSPEGQPRSWEVVTRDQKEHGS